MGTLSASLLLFLFTSWFAGPNRRRLTLVSFQTRFAREDKVKEYNLGKDGGHRSN